MLKQWKTPFEDHSFPSISLNLKTHFGNIEIFVKADESWKIKFEDIVAIKICEEEFDLNERFHVTRKIDGKCCYIWEDSNWLSEFAKDYAETIKEKKLKHYVLLGGDHNIEVLALGTCEVKRIGG